MMSRYFITLYLNQPYRSHNKAIKDNRRLPQVDLMMYEEYLKEVGEWLEAELQS